MLDELVNKAELLGLSAHEHVAAVIPTDIPPTPAPLPASLSSVVEAVAGASAAAITVAMAASTTAFHAATATSGRRLPVRPHFQPRHPAQRNAARSELLLLLVPFWPRILFRPIQTSGNPPLLSTATLVIVLLLAFSGNRVVGFRKSSEHGDQWALLYTVLTFLVSLIVRAGARCEGTEQMTSWNHGEDTGEVSGDSSRCEAEAEREGYRFHGRPAEKGGGGLPCDRSSHGPPNAPLSGLSSDLERRFLKLKRLLNTDVKALTYHHLSSHNGCSTSRSKKVHWADTAGLALTHVTIFRKDEPCSHTGHRAAPIAASDDSISLATRKLFSLHPLSPTSPPLPPLVLLNALGIPSKAGAFGAWVATIEPPTAETPSGASRVLKLDTKPELASKHHTGGCGPSGEPTPLPQDTISSGLANHFGGYPTDFLVAKHRERDFIVFLPEWVQSESLIRRELVSLGDFRLRCFAWNPYVGARRFLPPYKAWIRLVSLPYECWSSRTVASIVGGFGRFLRADDFTTRMADLSSYRCLVAVNYLSDIPENVEISFGGISISSWWGVLQVCQEPPTLVGQKDGLFAPLPSDINSIPSRALLDCCDKVGRWGPPNEEWTLKCGGLVNPRFHWSINFPSSGPTLLDSSILIAPIVGVSLAGQHRIVSIFMPGSGHIGLDLLLPGPLLCATPQLTAFRAPPSRGLLHEPYWGPHIADRASGPTGSLHKAHPGLLLDLPPVDWALDSRGIIHKAATPQSTTTLSIHLTPLRRQLYRNYLLRL
uniref:Uncharacterized protein n=1 Tax=Ananas comosus var. bracteatus TaxID=296719 RepID=A0A6V7NYJ3_ANACO|nr:unnamed protein product [Ananas comosus var. bracteatus]